MSDHPSDSIIKIDQNTEKRPGYLIIIINQKIIAI